MLPTWGDPQSQRWQANPETVGTYLVAVGPRAYAGSEQLPGTHLLRQNVPNPFNSSTLISYHVGETNKSGWKRVQLDIFNILGQKIRTLVDTDLSPGSYSVLWDGTNDTEIEMSSGHYFVRLRIGDSISKIKMVMVK